MGTDILKCRCACNKEDQLTENLEKEHIESNIKSPSVSNQISPLDSKNKNPNNNLPQSNGLPISPPQDLRNYVSVKANNFSNINQNMNDLLTPSFMNKISTFSNNNNNNYNNSFCPNLNISPYNNNTNSNNNKHHIYSNNNKIPLNNITIYTNEHINSIILIQSTFRGYNYRGNCYSDIKRIQIEETNQMFKSLTEEYETFLIKTAERNYGNEYSKKGWKLFYSDKNNLTIETLSNNLKDILSYNYGLIFNTKILLIPNEAFYTGQTNIDNKKHGYGILITKDGNKYEGFWNNDAFTGWGRIIDNEGCVIEGIFIDSVLNGKGIKTCLNGNIYIGDFVNNVREGKGKEITNEHVYEGEFKDDKKNGKGKLVYKQIKDIYEGEFVDNAITGNGFYIWGNKDTYKGSFVNGKMHGKGLYKWPDGGEYYGDYVNNIKEGFGIFKWTNGKTYEGEFKNGKPDGAGKLKANRKEMEVEFKDGRLITNIKDIEKIK